MTIKFHALAEGQGVSAYLRGEGWERSTLDDADVICFNGGADIATTIYGERPALRGVPLFQSYRDTNEIEVFERFRNNPSVLKLGICRGAQLLNCLNGGTLWQDVNNHGSNHNMTILETGHVMKITSTHHQMMRPNYKTAVMIGVSNESTYKLAEGMSYPEAYFDDHGDPEIVYYPDTNSLCIQGHPEYVPGSEFADYCVELALKYLAKGQGVPLDDLKWGSC